MERPIFTSAGLKTGRSIETGISNGAADLQVGRSAVAQYAIA